MIMATAYLEMLAAANLALQDTFTPQILRANRFGHLG
jgi:hypothetical protein